MAINLFVSRCSNICFYSQLLHRSLSGICKERHRIFTSIVACVLHQAQEFVVPACIRQPVVGGPTKSRRRNMIKRSKGFGASSTRSGWAVGKTKRRNEYRTKRTTRIPRGDRGFTSTTRCFPIIFVPSSSFRHVQEQTRNLLLFTMCVKENALLS